MKAKQGIASGPRSIASQSLLRETISVLCVPISQERKFSGDQVPAEDPIRSSL